MKISNQDKIFVFNENSRVDLTVAKHWAISFLGKQKKCYEIMTASIEWMGRQQGLARLNFPPQNLAFTSAGFCRRWRG